MRASSLFMLEPRVVFFFLLSIKILFENHHSENGCFEEDINSPLIR